jgi:hypothetical protein
VLGGFFGDGLPKPESASNDERRRLVMAGLLIIASGGLVASVMALGPLDGSPAAPWVASALTAVTILGAVGYRLHFGLGIRPSKRSAKGIFYALAVGVAFLSGGLLLPNGQDSASGELTVRSPTIHGVFQVTATCADGWCGGIGEHRKASLAGSAANQLRHKDGELLAISCQKRGEIVQTRRSPIQRSSIWDRLADGFYVSDLYVNTPAKGDFSPSLPRC